MEQDLLTGITETNSKVYKTRTIVIATFLGGLLAGSYMLYRNFNAFNEASKAKATIFITLFLFILLIGSAFVPALNDIPGVLYSLAITFLIAWAAGKYQKENISLSISRGSGEYSTGNVVLICICSLVITVAFYLVPYLLSDLPVNP